MVESYHDALCAPQRLAFEMVTTSPTQKTATSTGLYLWGTLCVAVSWTGRLGLREEKESPVNLAPKGYTSSCFSCHF